jgi:hypothetical protein
MKKIIIGCVLTAVGALSSSALLISLSFHINTLGSWSVPPGKFICAIESTGASLLIFPLVIATIIFMMGLYFLFEEYLRKLLK